MNIIAKETRHLRGKDLKISLSRRLSSETAQLNYLLKNRPEDEETKQQQHLLAWLVDSRKLLG
jgi:hypothetical protein